MKIITIWDNPNFCLAYNYDASIEVENVQVIPDMDKMQTETVSKYGRTFNSRPYVSGEQFDCDLLIWCGFDPYYCPQWDDLANSMIKCDGVKILKNIKSMNCSKSFLPNNSYFWKSSSEIFDGCIVTNEGYDDVMMMNFGYDNVRPYPFIIDQEFIDKKVDYDKVTDIALYGYAGFGKDRMYEYTALFGNMLTKNLPFRRVSLVSERHKPNDPDYTYLKSWTLNPIEIIEKNLSMQQMMDLFESSMICVSGGIGRFAVEALAMGVPTFGNIIPFAYDEILIPPEFDMTYRNNTPKIEMVKRMMRDKPYREEIGEKCKQFASKFGIIPQTNNMKAMIEWAMNLKK